jgi:hypothetical protein
LTIEVSLKREQGDFSREQGDKEREQKDEVF